MKRRVTENQGPRGEPVPADAEPIASDARPRPPDTPTPGGAADAGTDATSTQQTSSWLQGLTKGTEAAVRETVCEEIGDAIKARSTLSGYLILGLMDDGLPISSWHADRIYEALTAAGAARSRDVLLILWSRGGSVEPAYQISKLCKKFAKSVFGAAIPRRAKSAATLITLGADHIHMGDLSELGPIDTQLGGLPALAVRDALRTIAQLSEEYPGSAKMFAEYLTRSVTIQQIGYLDRIAVSASQYAERLLSTKSKLPDTAQAIANKLVEGYKDHGFVIDADEARDMLGAAFVGDGSEELALADDIYGILDLDTYICGRRTPPKQLSLVGDLSRPDSVRIWDKH